jgi:predicted enzyme related to lactoylglutathione lyase
MRNAEAGTCIDLTVDDVPAGATFFREVLALPVRQRTPGDVEVRLSPDLTARLRETAVPRPVSRPPGVILEIQVPDLRGALTELRRRGATVLVEPVLTEWGTESAFVAGPEDMVIELFRPRER